MAEQLERDPVFGALTRPQMFAGVTYSFFVLNGVVTAELFLITKSFWALLAALVIHAIGEFCKAHDVDLTSAPALIGVEICVYFAATILFFVIERPFLQLRHRLAPRK